MATKRPQCSVYIAHSLDGYIARRDGAIDWLELVHSPEEDYGYQAFFDTVDAMILGRSTYDVAVNFDPWPYGNKRCVVLTHRPTEPRHNEEFFHGDITVLLDQLAAAGIKRVYVDGGSVISQFLKHGLIDDLTLSIVPVLLGEGISLFQGLSQQQNLSLVSSKSFNTGLVQLYYHTAHYTPHPSELP